MPMYLFFLYYLNVLIEVLLGIYICGFDSPLLFKCTPGGSRRWKRTLAVACAERGDDILNDKGLSILQVEDMCKKKDASLSDKIYGLSLHDTKDLFVELTNSIMYTDYEEQVKTEKNIFTCTQRTLKFMKENIKKKTEELITGARKYIDELFGSYDILNKKEWESISKLNLFLDINGEEDVLLINGRDIFFHVMGVNFPKKIPLNTQDVLENITELFRHNKNIFEQYEKKVHKIEKDIRTYLGTGGKRFPLNYTHWNNSYINITQNVAVRAFMDDLYNYFEHLERKLMYNPNRLTKIDISFLDGTLDAIDNIIKSTIEYKTEKLFGLLNNIFKGDLRSILGFFTYLFDTERRKNKIILKTIAKEKTGDEYDSNFLFDVESLYVREKEDIQNALSKFSHFMKVNFGFDVGSPSVHLLKSKIEDAVVQEQQQQQQIMKHFKNIVHELLCRQQVIEFFTLVNSLKENSKGISPCFWKVWGCLTAKNDNCIYIKTKKLIQLVSKYAEIREKNNCNIKQNDSEENILELMKDIKSAFYRYRIAIKILFLLIEDLKLSKQLNEEYENLLREKKEAQEENYGITEKDKDKMDKMYEKAINEWTSKLEAKKMAIESNKNAIIFYLCLIKTFKLS
ncbi:Uncharacterized protein PCOAH_00037010 [Plasmodium coatneyi]|uniref:Uncharacterized protein n=1 Tax=Plasmodium coatneyi TaxID=208452 RepID=A0A1B1E1J4_9APIC|nr:Uncharacterized protein PCOAH_00037010 [Plasmodium coatneyi]ANQ08898.1 Uncharacterized protein PCOAH_00037010 [Plasmodium coatneyi]